jgi:hypothetical protein
MLAAGNDAPVRVDATLGRLSAGLAALLPAARKFATSGFFLLDAT